MKLRLTAILLLLPFYLCGQAAPDWNPTPTPSSGTVVGQVSRAASTPTLHHNRIVLLFLMQKTNQLPILKD